MSKYLHFIFGLSMLFSSSNAKAQFTEKTNLVYKGASYNIFIIKVDSALLNHFSFFTNQKKLSESEYFDSLSLSIQKPFFAITSSIVDSACNPLGLYIENGKKISNLNLNKGTGNFFLKPNGVISIDESDNLNIQNAALFKPTLNYRNAIQTGPILLSEGLINPTFDKNSKNRNIRCGVGLFTEKKEKFIVFIKSNTTITFYQLCEIFHEKFHSSNALNLENSVLCSMHFPTDKIKYRSSVFICRYIVISL